MYKYVCVCGFGICRYHYKTSTRIWRYRTSLKCRVRSVHPHHSRLRPKLEDGSDGITTA